MDSIVDVLLKIAASNQKFTLNSLAKATSLSKTNLIQWGRSALGTGAVKAWVWEQRVKGRASEINTFGLKAVAKKYGWPYTLAASAVTRIRGETTARGPVTPEEVNRCRAVLGGIGGQMTISVAARACGISPYRMQKVLDKIANQT